MFSLQITTLLLTALLPLATSDFACNTKPPKDFATCESKGVKFDCTYLFNQYCKDTKSKYTACGAIKKCQYAFGDPYDCLPNTEYWDFGTCYSWNDTSPVGT